ncbi:RES family NAD+ phosphorylase [Herbaspirillum seropedicae]|uniref:RES family NAD+ phosphorylase n=1 Tax=Herbaspirillum seropedicae TaxID=964 RepID=UPI00084803C8|nr:RES family NAD+ phosphorylase [Herbaspirillum seropedicae]AON56987.1 RES domain-containing protein [Herbaspirillum seropedicae]
MILTPLQTVAYRVHSPRWAYAPLSGQGAARFGGRLNRPGVEALYLSLEPATALAEYQQFDDLLPPGLVVTYMVKIDPVVDFRGGLDEAWNSAWAEFYCDWRSVVFQEKREPPSWALGEQARAAGAKGILFRSSVLKEGCNLVVFNRTLTDQDLISIHDPGGELPLNQLSWPRS